MAAALGTYSTVEVSKARRIEGHTSNVDVPIQYQQTGKLIIAETTESGDTYILPHKITNPTFITLSPYSATGVTFCSAVSFPLQGTATSWTQITTAALAGASTVVLTSGSAINDTYNECYLDLRYSDGSIQTVKIADYVGSGTIATLYEPLAKAIATTGTYWRLRGTVLTTTGAAATPTIGFMVQGGFDG